MVRGHSLDISLSCPNRQLYDRHYSSILGFMLKLRARVFSHQLLELRCEN